MVICPKCKSAMKYKSGTSNGKKYEFYGCSRYPECRQIVEIEDADEYDNGEKNVPLNELPMDEQKEIIRDTFIMEGESWSESSFIADRWEKF